MGNSSLGSAKSAKNDEFYTQISDIEKEMKYYEQYFKDKHIFCNCDDPEWSNFWRFFALNFHRLGLKQLTSTHYEAGSSSYRMDMFKQVPDNFKDRQTFLTLEETGIELPLGYITPLQGDGDFKSDEAIEILKECDLVITNPPFSIAREDYVPQLFQYEKKFLIVGDLNWITYKTIFPLLKDNKLWLGINNIKEFRTPSGDIKKFGNKLWYTNLDHSRRHEELILYKKYNEQDYPTYDNYNAIEVSVVTEIPTDYDGAMGVPISFFNKYNPDQFSILGISKTWATDFEVTVTKKYTNALQHNQDGKVLSGNKVNDGAVVTSVEKPEKGVYYTAAESEHFLQQKYARIFIKRL